MKNIKKLVALVAVLALSVTSAMADVATQKPFVETYAHPTMFSSDAQEVATADATYIVGGKIKKSN